MEYGMQLQFAECEQQCLVRQLRLLLDVCRSKVVVHSPVTYRVLVIIATTTTTIFSFIIIIICMFYTSL
jgi:hypothetical protein